MLLFYSSRSYIFLTDRVPVVGVWIILWIRNTAHLLRHVNHMGELFGKKFVQEVLTILLLSIQPYLTSCTITELLEEPVDNST